MEYSNDTYIPGQWYVSAATACAVVNPARTAQYNAANPNAIRVEKGYQGTSCLGEVHRKSDNALLGADNVALKTRADSCPVGWYKTDAGCVMTPPPQVVTPEQIEEEMAPKPLPQTLPPGFPYPLDPTSPFIFEPDTANPPNAQPLRVPQGNPVPIPNTNPQQYRQPVTRFTPAPTAEDPFRLDARPEDLTGTSPTGITGPQTVTNGTPDGDKPEQFDLCKEHPDILACQVFKPDELEAKPVPNENKNLSITPDSGWGASSASCPTDKHATLSFGPIAFSYEPLCLFATGIRPMVIALAWFSAALTFFGFARKDA